MLLAALLGGCAAHQVGLIVADPLKSDPAELRLPRGGDIKLATPGPAGPLRYLNGCVVDVHGSYAFRTFTVRDWRVLDAGDGSGGYVGILRAYGARLVVDDRNSGATVVLDDLTAAPMRPYVGLPVLVIGHATGEGYVVPVAYRVLAATSPP